MSNKEELLNEDKLITDIVMSVLDSSEYVSRLKGSLANTLTMGLIGSDDTEGIKIGRSDKGADIDIHLIVYYGVNIPQLSYDIQTRIHKKLQDETDIKLQSINIIVEGIDRK